MGVSSVFAVVLVLASSAAASAGSAPTAASPQSPPDLNGVWTNASITKLTRPAGQTKGVVSQAEATALAAPQVRGLETDDPAANPKSTGPRYGAVGQGYNTFWTDPGRSLAKVNGQYRTSWIVEPQDGQLPFSEEGRVLVAKAAAYARRADTPGGPEELQPWDRCLISSRGSGGPGMLNNIYNSNYQIVQTKDAVAILVEMVHDVRIIPIFPNKAAAEAGHGPKQLHPWLGDSVGWWEASTLVVETVRVNPEQGRAGPIYLSSEGRVTERFRRVNKDEIFYEFNVEDPTYYSRPWRAEMTLTANNNRIFEYACHEGNYALANILRGARTTEKASAAKASAAAPETPAKSGDR